MSTIQRSKTKAKQSKSIKKNNKKRWVILKQKEEQGSPTTFKTKEQING